MLTKRRFRTAFGSVAGALLLLGGGAGAGQAGAAVLADTPPAGACRYLTTEYASTCFAWVGDDQWIRDLDPNGWAAVVHVQTNYGKDRYCQAQPAADGWNYCKFDHEEGKCVRFMMYEAKGEEKRRYTAWTPWYGTEYGWPC
ncbi:hypothetical protein [Streptomyces sp. SID13031]|uniref:hypothetical protein n=1 Tax=Streptomyces sp. SID13031 TaxID=2706046 RepID=UPI0013CAEF5D|nr:hypothetical protein [Streptomyces sp. SID13031]NEA34523.1 hypothetical protein [Streptomyces sp. SID13031]